PAREGGSPVLPPDLLPSPRDPVRWASCALGELSAHAVAAARAQMKARPESLEDWEASAAADAHVVSLFDRLREARATALAAASSVRGPALRRRQMRCRGSTHRPPWRASRSGPLSGPRQCAAVRAAGSVHGSPDARPVPRLPVDRSG